MGATLWTEHDIGWQDHWQLSLAYVASGRSWENARKQAAIDLAVAVSDQVREDPSAGRVCVSTADVPHRSAASAATFRVRIGWTEGA